MKKTNFRYINKGKDKTLVLIPGWATDCRIFGPLDFDYNYLIPEDFSPFGFEKSLADAVRAKGLKKISLFGWSLGGFVAQDFALEYPDLVERLIFVSVKKRYEKDGLDKIRKHLARGREGYLYKFYSQCFCERENLKVFKKELLGDYLDKFNEEKLFNVLDYLESSAMKPELLRGIDNIKIIHGDKDRIAPVEEAIELKRNLEGAELTIIKNTGHMPFLSGNFTPSLRGATL